MTERIPAAGRIGSSYVAVSMILLGVEEHEVGERALAHLAAPGEPEHRGRLPGHPVHRVLQVDEPLVPGVVPEHPGKRAPQAGVGEGVVRQAVGTDHGSREREDPGEVLLVHHEVDPAGGLEAFHRFRHFATPIRARSRRGGAP